VTVGWAGLRAYTLGALPAGSFRLIERSEAKTAPPLVPTEFPSIAPVETADAQPAAAYPYAPPPTQMMPLQIRPIAVPVYYGVNSVRVPLPPAPSAEPVTLPQRPRPAYTQLPNLYAQLPDREEYPFSRLASLALGQGRSSAVPMQSTPAVEARRIDRWQVSAWALLRNQQAGGIGPSSLASSGNLGGSQAGARLTYAISRQIAASFRTTSDIGRRGFEVAGGVRVQPLMSIPVWITAERRQRIGQFGGRNAFAIFA
jgi:hypothetical protein